MEENGQDDFIHLVTVYDSFEAHFIHGLLESHGIEALVAPRGVGEFTEIMETSGQEIPVLVKSGDLEDARLILGRAESDAEDQMNVEIAEKPAGNIPRSVLRSLWLAATVIFFILAYIAASRPEPDPVSILVFGFSTRYRRSYLSAITTATTGRRRFCWNRSRTGRKRPAKVFRLIVKAALISGNSSPGLWNMQTAPMRRKALRYFITQS